ncbi:MAG TPA: peptidyl-prolyl cis-trans isomerase [Acidobacteriaceae bacterium]|jgi:peptidyl-prolyl cis-trans isomerase D
MIRFLQQDSKAIKIMFGVIIGAAAVSMVVYLVPGLMDATTTNDVAVYATVHEPGLMGRLFGESTPVKSDEVTRLAQQQLHQNKYPDFLLPYMMSRAGQILVQRAMLKQEADRLHLQVSDNDLRRELQTGPFAQYLFPDGKYIGDDAFINFIQSAIGQDMTIATFQEQVKEDMEIQRLQALITGGVTVSDAAVRDAYRVQGTKVKFDYAVVSSEDLKKTINPSDADLQKWFKDNSAKYASAIPETRQIAYVSFDASKLPGGKQPVTDADIQAYYSAHAAEYKTEEQVKTRHILINARTGVDAQTDAAAKAKAQDVLKQVQAGGNFAELAKKYSDDPGSKDTGGELPMMPTAGLDPAYGKAAMALNPGQTSGLVKSSFGYHIIQTEQKQAAGTKPLAEVKDSISQILQQQKQGAAEQQFAQQLAQEAKKDGLDKTAAAHGLHVVTTDYVAKGGVIGGLSDSSALLGQAFTTDKNAAPGTAATGDGYAVFRVVDVKPAHAPDFASYKAHVLDDYREQKIPELLQQTTNKLADRAKVLNDLKKAAAELKVPYKSSDFVGQDGQVTDVGSMSGPGKVAFDLPKGAISGAINAGQSGVVLTVLDKQEPSTDEIAKNFDQMREQLLNSQRQQIFSVFLGTLSQRYQNGGGVKLAKQAAATPGVPSGS